MKKIPFDFIEEVIIRSPIYPYKKNLSVNDIYSLIEDDFFLESIYVSSPLLYEECLKLKENKLKTEKDKERIINSLYKYYSRMSTRSTPFGLFSSCGVSNWEIEENENVKERFIRHTRLDMHFLQMMVSALLQITYISDLLLYHPNNSIYMLGEEVRYIEYSYINGFKKYRISAISKNNFVLKIFEVSKDGMSKKELIASMLEEGVNESDAKSFIENLITSQLIVSEFEVQLTGVEDFAAQLTIKLDHLYQRTNSWYILSIFNFFSDIVADLRLLDKSGTNKVEEYKKIISKLVQLQPNLDEAKTFHIDSYITNSKKYIRNSAKSEIMELLSYFIHLNDGARYYNNNIVDFKKKFTERYESQSISLIEALDDDIGIGYPISRRGGASPLVDDIPFGQEKADLHIQMGGAEKWLFDVIRNYENSNLYSIQLDKQKQTLNFESSKPINWNFFPKSISAMFKLLDDDKNTIYFEGFVGPSASSLLSRFTYGNKEIKNVTEKIIQKEEENVKNCILAEIVHLPDNRVTNVIMHPPFIKYEIPYLAASSKSKENTIDVNDLYIKIENNDIILFSKKLNKRVFPRKTNMHNHVIKSLPLYYLLADIQADDNNRIIGLPMGQLMKMVVFIPRLYYKKIIVSPAIWNFTQTMIDCIKKVKIEGLLELILDIRKQYNIPNKVLYTEGDNELLVDFSNSISIQVWVSIIIKRTTIQLKEFLWEGNNELTHINQYIASILWTGEKEQYQNPLLTDCIAKKIPKRTFSVGEEWLYLKLYCGIGSADIILTKIISKVINHISNQGLVKKWFYIKYQDPDYHIRLRLQMKDPTEIYKTISIIKQEINESKDHALIWKLVPDNYEREIERYGASSMEICESIFYVDSTISILLIKILNSKNSETNTLLWGMKLVDDMLSDFKFTLKEKIHFTDLNKQSFQQQFNAEKNSLDKMNSKFNSCRSLMNEVMSNVLTDNKYKREFSILEQKKILQKDYINEILKMKDEDNLDVNYMGLISSLIHMMLNRLITQKERLHEFLIYEFLFKYYKMITNKEKLH